MGQNNDCASYLTTQRQILKVEVTEKHNIRNHPRCFRATTNRLLAVTPQIAAVSVNIGDRHFLWVMCPERSELHGGTSITASVSVLYYGIQ